MMCFRVRVDGKVYDMPEDVLMGCKRKRGLSGLKGIEILKGPFWVDEPPKSRRQKDATGNLFGPDAEYVDVKY